MCVLCVFMFVCRSTNPCMHVFRSEVDEGVFLYNYFFKNHLLVNLELVILTILAVQQAPTWACLCHLTQPSLEWHTEPLTRGFYVGSGDLNLGSKHFPQLQNCCWKDSGTESLISNVYKVTCRMFEFYRPRTEPEHLRAIRHPCGTCARSLLTWKAVSSSSFQTCITWGTSSSFSS